MDMLQFLMERIGIQTLNSKRCIRARHTVAKNYHIKYIE